MPLDGCPYTFEELAEKVLPDLMGRLRETMKTPHEASWFCSKGRGVKTLVRELGLTRDPSGLYVFLEADRPIYVGISRHVLARLRQHLTGDDHFLATLVYSMAYAKWGRTARRSELMKNAGFMKQFRAMRDELRGCKVAFIEIDDPVTMYLFEVYAAMKLDTGQWNEFKTH